MSLHAPIDQIVRLSLRRTSYLWASGGAENVTVIPRIPFDGPTLLIDLDMIQSKGGLVVSLVQTKGQLVDFARMVLLDDTAETEVLEDYLELLAPVNYAGFAAAVAVGCRSGSGGGRWRLWFLGGGGRSRGGGREVVVFGGDGSIVFSFTLHG